MRATAPVAFGPDPQDARGVSRAIGWSLAVHVALVAFLLLAPREWFSRPPKPENIMTISLGGTPGPRTTGMTSIGGRTVEQAVPPPKRPQPIERTPPAPVAPVREPPPPRPRPSETPSRESRPVVTPLRPPTTGPQVQQGPSPVETGAHGQSLGLSFGGGGSGGDTDLKDFCCPEYINLLQQRIDQHWNKHQADRGATVIRFTIHKDGSIGEVEIEQSSGNGVLDRASRAAVVDIKLPELPSRYPFDTLTVHLKFPYEGQ